MALLVLNSTSNTVYVAVGYPNSGCTGVTAKRGWYAVPPGRTVPIYGGSVSGWSFWWYAEDAFGHVWAGDSFTDVPNEAFDMCWIEACPPPRCRRLGFRKTRYFGDWFQRDYTIRLVLASSVKKSKSDNVLIALPTKRKFKFRKYQHGIINKRKFKYGKYKHGIFDRTRKS